MTHTLKVLAPKFLVNTVRINTSEVLHEGTPVPGSENITHSTSRTFKIHINTYNLSKMNERSLLVSTLRFFYFFLHKHFALSLESSRTSEIGCFVPLKLCAPCATIFGLSSCIAHIENARNRNPFAHIPFGGVYRLDRLAFM